MRGIRSNRLADGVKKKVMCNNKSCGDHVNDRFAMCEKLTKCVDRSTALRHLTFAHLQNQKRAVGSEFHFPFRFEALPSSMCVYFNVYNVYVLVQLSVQSMVFRYTAGRRRQGLGTWIWVGPGPQNSVPSFRDLVLGAVSQWSPKLGCGRDLDVVMGEISPNIDLNIGTQNILSHVSCYLMDEITFSCKYGLPRG